MILLFAYFTLGLVGWGIPAILTRDTNDWVEWVAFGHGMGVITTALMLLIAMVCFNDIGFD